MSKTNRKIAKGLLIAAVAAIALLGVAYNAQLRPAKAKGAPYQFFNVPQGSNAPYIGRKLQEAGLIRSKDAFITFLGLHGLRGSLKAGEFSLSPSQSTPEIARALTGGASARQFTVPPGATLKQIEEAAASHGISQADFEAAISAGHPQSVLASRPPGVSLEGYLYPDTYDLGSGISAGRLVDTMINTLQAKLTPDIIQKWQAEGLSVHQGLTLASIVEKEVGPGPDRSMVAQVFLNRLKAGMPLGSDVTAFYASSLAGISPNVSIQSPYNTRINPGLPPGPICSPDLSAMQAVASPSANDYLYFLAGKDGKIYYAKTYAEHQRNIQQHL